MREGLNVWWCIILLCPRILLLQKYYLCITTIICCISVVSVSESEKDVSLINPEALDKTADAFIYAVTFW